MLHLEKPLCGQLRLDGHVGTLGETYFVVVVLDLLHQSLVLKVNGNLLTHVHTVLADIHAGGFRDGAVVVEDVDGLEVMLQSEVVVVDIVGRCDLQTAGTELDVHIVVLNHGDGAVDQWHNDVQALQPGVFHIIGVDAHGRVAHDGLRTCGGYHCVVAVGILVDDIAFVFADHLALVGFGHVVFEIVELGVLFLVDDFLVRQCGLGFRVPVDHAGATIEKTLAVEVDKNVDDALRPRLVHGEGRAVPVA